MPSSTFPGLGGSQIDPILPPTPTFDIEGDPHPYHLLNRAALLICIAFHWRAGLPLGTGGWSGAGRDPQSQEPNGKEAYSFALRDVFTT